MWLRQVLAGRRVERLDLFRVPEHIPMAARAERRAPGRHEVRICAGMGDMTGGAIPGLEGKVHGSPSHALEHGLVAREAEL